MYNAVVTQNVMKITEVAIDNSVSTNNISNVLQAFSPD